MVSSSRTPPLHAATPRFVRPATVTCAGIFFELGSDPTTNVPGKTMFLQTVLDPAGREQEPPPTSSSKDLLEAAYTLMNALASNFNPCDLVDRILETTTTAIRAHRGAVLFAGPGGQLEPCGVCGHVHTVHHGSPEPARVAEINISESVAHRVLRDGENVLYQGGWADGSVDPSASIAALNLTSILCVPIRTQNEVLGILYMDTDVADHAYTDDDLLLAAAAGNSAGLALENARNHQMLLEKQRMEQDIEAAWTIQAGFLVSDWPTDDPRFEVYGTTVPAKVVGGDFYDFARLDENRLGMLIGDVSCWQSSVSVHRGSSLRLSCSQSSTRDWSRGAGEGCFVRSPWLLSIFGTAGCWAPTPVTTR
jgi:hypothetical protein